MSKAAVEAGTSSYNKIDDKIVLSYRTKRVLAILVPLLFLADVLAMMILKLQGGDATALIGGTAVFILIAITMLAHRNQGLGENDFVSD